MYRGDVLELQKIVTYPCLTITLPTHRTSPDNRQDPIRLRNLVREANERLKDEFGKREVAQLLSNLEATINDLDFARTLDGLAIFVNAETSYVYRVPFTLPERVVVDETFFTRDMVFAMNRTPRYWVVVLSEQPTRLFEATREDLDEVRVAGFPLTHGGPGGGSGLPNDPAVNSSRFRDEHHRIFFRSVDEALTEVLKEDPLPVAVVGVDRWTAFFSEITSNASHIVATVRGNHDTTPGHELGKLVWPEVKASLAERRNVVLDELGTAVGGQRSASTLGEVWRFAREGRGATLLVEENYHEAAILDESGFRLLPDTGESGPNHLDDAVDEAITMVMSMGGRVVFVEDGTLEQHGRIALILRY
ncbi:MAG: hypothetical protein EOM24_01065 [Chloroflexia bacterium]|nr:hypothetical protein [Chloroflexia bacterium]